MAARGPQNGQRGLERGLPLCFWHLRQLLPNKFFDLITPSMRKVDDGEKKKENNGKNSGHYVIATPPLVPKMAMLKYEDDLKYEKSFEYEDDLQIGNNLILTKPNQIYQTKPNLPNQTYQSKSTNQILPYQTYQTKPTIPNLPKQNLQNKSTKQNSSQYI